MKMMNPKKLTFAGKLVPRKFLKPKARAPVDIYHDRDGDGFPTPIDCEPNNPKKQGVSIGYTTDEGEKKEVKVRPFARLKEKYKEWKAKEPERREKKLQKLEYEEQKELIKARISKTRMATARDRMEVQERRTELMRQRQKAMPKMPSIFGGASAAPTGLPSLMTPAPGAMARPKAAAPVKRRKKRRKKKKK